jgi:hypothetical protein
VVEASIDFAAQLGLLVERVLEVDGGDLESIGFIQTKL